MKKLLSTLCALCFLISFAACSNSQAAKGFPSSVSVSVSESVSMPQSVPAPQEVSLNDKAEEAYAAIGIDIGNLATQIDDWANGERFKLIYNDKTYIAYCENGEVTHIRCQEEGNETYYENGEVLKYANPAKAIEEIPIPVINVTSDDLYAALSGFEISDFQYRDYVYGGQLASASTDDYSITLQTDNSHSICSAAFFALTADSNFLHEAALACASEEAASWVDANVFGDTELETDTCTLNIYQGNSGPVLEIYALGYAEYTTQIMALI